MTYLAAGNLVAPKALIWVLLPLDSVVRRALAVGLGVCCVPCCVCPASGLGVEENGHRILVEIRAEVIAFVPLGAVCDHALGFAREDNCPCLSDRDDGQGGDDRRSSFW